MNPSGNPERKKQKRYGKIFRQEAINALHESGLELAAEFARAAHQSANFCVRLFDPSI